MYKRQRFYTTPQLVKLYKTHVLPVLEFPTPAVYHATNTALENLDKVQTHFLREVGLTERQALKDYHLAPLCTRRDIALLGLVHRTVLKKGPVHFQKWFFLSERQRHAYQTRLQERRHNRQLHDWLDGNHSELLRRSPLGLARVYNQLPQRVVDCSCVKDCQRELQELVRAEAERGVEDWHLLLSPRREQWVRR